jgi:hypothetical protein
MMTIDELISVLSEFDPSDLVVIKNRHGEWVSPDNVWAIPGGLDIGSEHTNAIAIEE